MITREMLLQKIAMHEQSGDLVSIDDNMLDEISGGLTYTGKHVDAHVDGHVDGSVG